VEENLQTLIRKKFVGKRHGKGGNEGYSKERKENRVGKDRGKKTREARVHTEKQKKKWMEKRGLVQPGGKKNVKQTVWALKKTGTQGGEWKGVGLEQ